MGNVFSVPQWMTFEWEKFKQRNFQWISSVLHNSRQMLLQSNMYIIERPFPLTKWCWISWHAGWPGLRPELTRGGADSRVVRLGMPHSATPLQLAPHCRILHQFSQFLTFQMETWLNWLGFSHCKLKKKLQTKLVSARIRVSHTWRNFRPKQMVLLFH